MGQCACKEAAIEVDKDIVIESPPPSGSSAAGSDTDVDKAPGCYASGSSAESTQSSSSLTQLDLGALPGGNARRKSLLIRGGVQRRLSGTSSSAGALRKDSLSTVDSFDGGSSEVSVSFSSVSEAPRFGDPASAALLEASARRLANSTPTPVTGGTDQIVERLRNLERRIPATRRNSGREDASQEHGLNSSGGGDQVSVVVVKRRNSVPSAPKHIFDMIEKALREGNIHWATKSETLASMLADDVEYTDLRGNKSVGKKDVLLSMDDGMEKLLRRISRSTRSGKTQMRNDHVRVKGDGPRQSGKRVWVMNYTFKLYVMQIRIQEEYVFDEQGLIKRLTRSMMTTAGQKLLTAAAGGGGEAKS